MYRIFIIIGILILIFTFSGKAQIPTAKEARKQALEARIKDSLLTVQMEYIRVNSAIKMAVDEGKDSAMVWYMNDKISNELLNKGYAVKYKEYLFKRWTIYW